MEEVLGSFVQKSVTRGTMTKYGYGWKAWCTYGDLFGWKDYYMTTASRTEKVRHFMNFLRLRYERGLREKQATEVGSAIRKYFEIKMKSTEWLDDPQVKIARRACRRSAAENRAYGKAQAGQDKKPIWYDLLAQIREEHWEGLDYSHLNIDRKMVAINCMFSYDLALRRGESNQGGKESEDHTLRNEDLTFLLYEPVDTGAGGVVEAIRGGTESFRKYVEYDNVSGCVVQGYTHKAGVIHAGKMIETRTDEEELLLMDLVEWVHHSGSGPEDPIFSRYAQFPGKPRMLKKCTPKMVNDTIKGFVRAAGLDPKGFALHSLRKGCVTQLKAYGVEREEANARGNYAKDSIMVQTVYNCNDTGRGPLAASGSSIGRRVGVKDVSRQFGAAYEA
jgi:hypothetical protein